jgi:membrane associated rhomboid family serine protease
MIPLPQMSFNRTPVTLIVTALAAALEIASTVNPELRDHYYMTLKLGMLSPIWSGEVWRPFTTCLLHGNLVHAAFNIYWTLIFGQVLETRLGPWRYLFLFALLGYVSSLVQFLVSNLNTPLDGQAGLVGLSGILYGLFGILWVGRRWREEYWNVCNNDTVRLLIIWFFLCIAMTHFNVMRVGNVAHGTGLAFGCLYGLVMYDLPHRVPWAVLAVLSSLIVLATLIGCPGHGLYEKHKRNELLRQNAAAKSTWKRQPSWHADNTDQPARHNKDPHPQTT